MPGNFKKEDIRYLKTHKAIMTALTKILRLRNFSQITVNDLCEEALIGRPTFYSHFSDKYDLLKQWLPDLKIIGENSEDDYEGIEKKVNFFVDNNRKAIQNLVENANVETYQLLCDFIFSLLDVNIDKTDNEQINPQYIVLFKFCSGGIMNYLLWQIENKFPIDLPVMNPSLYNMLATIQKWNTEQE